VEKKGGRRSYLFFGGGGLGWASLFCFKREKKKEFSSIEVGRRMFTQEKIHSLSFKKKERKKGRVLFAPVGKGKREVK